MTLDLLTIEPKEPRKAKKGKRLRAMEKTRVFTVRMLGYLAADSLWDVPESEKRTRPVLIAYLGTDQELQPFTANFRGGRPAACRYEGFVIPKSSGHRWPTQKLSKASVTVAYLPDLFDLEPIAVEDWCQFVFAPPRWWIEAQAKELYDTFGDDAEDAARAALFTAYIDRRTPMPIVNDLRFHLQLYRAAQETKWCHGLGGSAYQSPSLYGDHHPHWGFDTPLSVSLRQVNLKEFLVQQTSLYHEKEMQNGTSRFQANRRLLSLPQNPAQQLCLNFAV